MASNEDYERDPRAYRAGLNSRDAEVQQLRKEVEALTEAALDHRATASRALEERDRLGDALYAAYVATGADADGAQDWRQLFLPITSPSWTAVITDEINQLRVDADSDVARAEADRDRYAAAIRRAREIVQRYAHTGLRYALMNAEDGPLASVDSGSASVGCGHCWKCMDASGISPMGYVLCPVCGNKRCPKAADHDLACTHSNASGQPGATRYPRAEQIRKEGQ